MDNSFPDELDYNSLSWERYRSSKASHGVLRYAVGDNAIWIEFQDKKVYLYTEKTCGNGKRAEYIYQSASQRQDALRSSV